MESNRRQTNDAHFIYQQFFNYVGYTMFNG